MAQIYGDRWRISSSEPLGKGGQAEVFRVIDTLGEYEGEFALKRVLNPNRHERFRREVEAIKTIQHPNIIQLIDHSVFADSTGKIEKQYFVMPIAHGGDLGQKGRVELYKGSIDGVIQVGTQLTSALTAAHTANVIHRDLKPGNVLFTGNGHETWLSDFGICLLREQTRLTDPEEVVGPRSFMAPELEDGSQLDVTPAADIYSLGKVLYYMLSGGVTIPRERLTEPKYNQILLEGERHRLLYSLLQQMICQVGQRLKTMSEVTQRLLAIEAWEKQAQVLPLTERALAGIHKLQLKAQESIRVADQEKTIREQGAERLEHTKQGFEMWLQSELEKTAAYINSMAILKCEVFRLSVASSNVNVTVSQGRHFILAGGLGLRLEPIGTSTEINVLQMALCREFKIGFTVSVGASKPKPRQPESDYRLAMIPYYQRVSGQQVIREIDRGFFTQKDQVGTIRGVVPRPSQRGVRPSNPYVGPLPLMTPTFLAGSSLIVEFRAAEWPEAINKLQPALNEAVDSFITFVESKS